MLLKIGIATQAAAQTTGCFYSEDFAFLPNSVSVEAEQVGAANLQLARNGNPVGLYKQGQIFTRNDLIAQNYDQAEVCIVEAISAGYDRGHYLLGIVYMRTGRGEKALVELDAARALGNDAAERQIAFGHLRGSFGAVSDPKLGFMLTNTLAEKGDVQAAYIAAQAMAVGRGTDQRLPAAFSDMLALAQAGHAPAMDFVAKSLARGEGVEQDTAAALGWYQKAIDAGFARSELGLARIHYQNRDYEMSIAGFERAVAQGVPGADLALARAHSDGRFGRISQYSDGWASLLELSEDGVIGASRAVLAKLGKGSGRPANIPFIEDQLTNAMEAGDGSAAASLARFYRERADLVVNARQKRKRVLSSYSEIMTDDALAIETVNDLARRNPRQLWPTLHKFLQNVPADAYKSTFVEIRRINTNAFVYALQKEMAAVGQYSGKASGRLTTSTLRSVLRICTQMDAFTACRRSPLGYTTVGILADGLMAIKAKEQ